MINFAEIGRHTAPVERCFIKRFRQRRPVNCVQAINRSEDGGATYGRLTGTHGDHHDFWIDPDDPTHLVVGNDGGGAVSTNTGRSWTDQEYPTAQFYHVVTTGHIPFHVCGSQQDNSTLCLPSAWNAGRFGFSAGGGF